MNNTNRTLSELTVLSDTARTLLNFGARALSKELSHSEDDHFAFMVIAFCFRQMEHLKSLFILYKNECFQDMQFIARSMLEGMAYLKWGYRNRDIVPFKWESYSWITDYRLAIKNTREGKDLDNVRKEMIVKGLDKYGKLFLKNKRKLIVDFEQDPFVNYWHIDDQLKKVRSYDLFSDMKAPQLIEVYEDLSDWVHWNISGIGKITTRELNEFSFNYDDNQSVKLSFATGLLSSFESFILLENHLKLELKEELNKIQEDYLNNLEEAKKSKGV
ncbi:MAG: DUF5677 domain-containing protein [Chitinispirillaceae bacterium]|jgi:hypothetical protein